MVNILTEREREIISKKMKGASLTQNESNILSKCIRPKLREMKKINPDEILNKTEYNQKATDTTYNFYQKATDGKVSFKNLKNI